MARLLAIETSCDETAVAVVEGDGQSPVRVLSNTVASQVAIHAEYGGVYPDVAAREHTRRIIPVLSVALKEAGLVDHVPLAGEQVQRALASVDAIAVTHGPGLIGPLLVGVSAAKQLATLTQKPLIPVNHWEGHLYSVFLQNTEKSQFPIPNSQTNLNVKIQNADVTAKDKSRRELLGGVGSNADDSSEVEETAIQPSDQTSNVTGQMSPNFPILFLTVSGGHTSIILMTNHFEYRVLGQTIDDAAGEAFDKTARLLGLGYPGGPAIGKHAAAAREVDATLDIDLPRPMLDRNNVEFSFSGLKTAVRYAIDRGQIHLPADQDRAARAIEDAIVDVLIAKLKLAVEHTRPTSVAIVGGVSANRELRRRASEELTIPDSQFPILLPERQYCTDNAAMIGAAGLFRYTESNGVLSEPLTLDANASLRLSSSA